MIFRTFTLALLLAALSVAGCGTKTETKTSAPTTPDLKIKAGDLMAAYSANAIGADQKYKGKVLQISGKYGSSQKVPFKNYAVQLLPEDSTDLAISGIQCFIVEAANADMGQLKEGQAISMIGNCDGQLAAGQIVMSKCTLVK